jgi:Uma2 family endonuclease
MSSVPVPQPALYEALLALPENLVGEIIDGELYTQPRPSGPHGNAETGLGTALRPPFHQGKGGPGGWWIIVEPEVHFKRDAEVAVPDLAGWRRERMPAIPQDHRYEVVPDWVCEILSPGTAKRDRSKKLPLYARYGVAHAWLVDPLERTLEVFELREGFWVLLGTLQDEDPVAMPPFDAVTFSLAELWT